MYCVETTNLVYEFSKKEVILKNVNLQVRQGSIYGFLGPNGAGKTTTLRLILGLLRKQQGDISIFGKPFHKNRIEILKKIGSLIESPSLYGHLTAIENLNLLQKIHQCPKERTKEVLRQVGLPDVGNKRVSQFSLGMKQRLSIAVALLHNPSLLVLDEPTNGLDPNGIIEVRELLKELNRENGITILISSHLLPEIERLVSHLGIINKGKMMFQGTLEELNNRQQQSTSVAFETNDEARTLRIIADQHLSSATKNGKIIISGISKEQIASLNRQLVDNGVEVYEISLIKNDLEMIFMDLINS